MVSAISMVDVLNTTSLKDMSEYLDDQWLAADQSSYNSYQPHYPDHAVTSEAPPYPYRHGSYMAPPKGVSSSSYAPSTPAFMYPSGSMGQRSYEGLGLSASPVFPALHSTISGSSLSSPNLNGQGNNGDSGRGRSYNSPLPPTPGTNHLIPTQPITIAPHPPILQPLKGLKRSREDSDGYDSGRASQRRRSTSTSLGSRPPVDLSEEEQLLLRLKHEESLPWKEIAKEFESRLGRSYQVPALQMRYKRLRERLRTWTDDDVQALKAAHEFWEKSKFEIISQKMMELGSAEKWPARLCERKWDELRGQYPPLESTDEGLQPLAPATSSPVHIDEAGNNRSPKSVTPTPQAHVWPFTEQSSGGGTTPGNTIIEFPRLDQR